MNIRIDNRDLAFTIDTYGTFTLDRGYENIIEYIIEEAQEQGQELDYNDIDELYEFDYDMKGYIEELASSSVHWLKQELVNVPKHFDVHGIVQDIKLEKTASPQFYNYTTDSYIAIWSIDEDKLKQYIDNNAQEFYEHVDEQWSFEYQKAIEELDEETKNVIRLDFMTRKELDEESHINCLLEVEESEFIEYKKIETKQGV